MICHILEVTDPVQADSRTRLRATVGSIPAACEVLGEMVCGTRDLIQTTGERPCARSQHLKTTYRAHRTSTLITCEHPPPDLFTTPQEVGDEVLRTIRVLDTRARRPTLMTRVYDVSQGSEAEKQ
ncbi:hypothetical protein EXIGLDRAFT_784536 [Exidia glandulosa HHB12029]|uniref:Uncharacterized protein n=1 Tax=Exidia glandulosa HHB12029 TaxID=1314781 RepID=A0A166MEL9_EXIGL|nr:hypothetical protein EXIGLDRAFT_784536 [Exidia glandulosa HHB12029]